MSRGETKSDGGRPLPDDPSALSVRRAAELMLEAKSVDKAEKTVRDYRDRLRPFVFWCEEHQIETVDEFSGFAFEQFRNERARTLAPASLKGQMVAVNQLVKYCERVGALEEGFHKKVQIPKLDPSDESSDVLLETEDAYALLDYYRDSASERGRPRHAVLELLWNTGARVGGIRGLDLGDYSTETEVTDSGVEVAVGYLDFVHRPQSDTPLKNKADGERVVRIPEPVVETLDHYIARERSDKRDDHGREPLFSGRQGRTSITSLRSWSYLATQPCVHMRCPHGNRKESCEYRHRNHASKCPSSRSPHQVRSGSITWQLDVGIPLEHVAERVNASASVIERFYDKADKRRKMQRREGFVRDLDVGLESDELGDSENDN